jgi:hypothetical protein
MKKSRSISGIQLKTVTLLRYSAISLRAFEAPANKLVADLVYFKEISAFAELTQSNFDIPIWQFGLTKPV